MFEQELNSFLSLGGEIEYENPVTNLMLEDNRVIGVETKKDKLISDAVILATGGFEANKEMRIKYLGENWEFAKVRGTPNNTGDGLNMALEIGALEHGHFQSCHATPMDLHMKNFGNLDLDPKERKSYRKICYFLGIMINANGKGVVVFINQSQSSDHILHRLKELKSIQKNGEIKIPPPIMDKKDFGIGAQILHELNIHKIELLTNRTQIKRVGMVGYGLEIVKYIKY